jgi:protein-tyrosine phosphatase
MSDIELSRLRQAVEFGYDRWKSGDRVLIRCQAGLNRSGLVLALILIKDGVAPEDAINLIRTHRGPDALFNLNFANWLITAGSEFIKPSVELSA